MISSSYRTVSEPIVLVIAEVTPTGLMAEERKRVFETKEELEIVEARMVAREHSMRC